MLAKIITILAIIAAGQLRSLEYEHRYDENQRSIHIIAVDPNQHLIVPAKAAVGELNVETVLSMTKRHGALAAVNGGFWKKNGIPAGILKINGVWHGTPVKPRGTLGWTSDGKEMLFDRVLTDHSLAGIENGQEIKVIPASKPPVTISEDWARMDHIMGGTPILVNGHSIVKDYAVEDTLFPFLVEPYARTAVGRRENGHWVFVTVDQPGMTIIELAHLMHDLECIDALNLSGGHSATMVFEGMVVNQTNGILEEEGNYVNPVSDAILIMP